MSELHPESSLFTVRFEPGEREMTRGEPADRPGQFEFDVAVVEFDDRGRFADGGQLGVVAERIRFWRERRYQSGVVTVHGVVVVLFIHGWHHNAAWKSPGLPDDKHFRDFRRLLRMLATREAERDSDRRRVIGICLGWNGDPRGYWFGSTPGLRNLSFHNRYGVAKRIGRTSDDLQSALREIIDCSKGSIDGAPPAQLVLIGHSMGGLILESGLLRLMKGKEPKLLEPLEEVEARPVQTRIGSDSVLFPDALLSLNSAADSGICQETVELLKRKGVRRQAESESGSVSYSPPLLFAVTSSADWATKYAWRLTRPLRTTIGHDRKIRTHTFRKGFGLYVPELLAGVDDFGQNFHILRPPRPARSRTPALTIDLPERDRPAGRPQRDAAANEGEPPPVPPLRPYRLEMTGNFEEALPFVWNFQVPPVIVPDHNDIFNPRSGSLLLALMQISGVIGSLAYDWESGFEPYSM